MAVHDPIKIGSASLSDLVPQPGAQITTNEFGIDTCELQYFFNSSDAALSSRPARGDAYAGGSSLPLGGFYVDDASVRLDEGKCAVLSVIYKKINSGRTAKIVAGSDVSYRFPAAIEDLGFFATDFFNLPVPSPTVTKRYASATAPHAVGSYDAAPSGFPSTPDWKYPLYTTGTHLDVIFRANRRGWANIRINSNPICENRFYEIEELWKIDYLFFGYSVG